VIVHGRREAAARAVVDALRKAGGEPLEPVIADLASFASVHGITRTLEARSVRVDVLVNNAGVYMNEETRSADGFETTIAVNHLAPFILTHDLLASPVGEGLKRIVNVSSMAHARGEIRTDDLSFERRGFDPYGTYATTELARRLGARATVNALHPGVVSTKLLTEGFGMRGPDSLAEGAATSVHLALDPSVAKVTGKYFDDCKIARASAAAGDAELARELYELSAKLTGTTPLLARA
jgi:NAD(P)-dependent dehydrogenase (short-subunit alcohol dehydrogenase family)